MRGHTVAFICVLFVVALICGLAYHDKWKRAELSARECPRATIVDLPADTPVVLRRGGKTLGLLNLDNDGDWRIVPINEKDLPQAKKTE